MWDLLTTAIKILEAAYRVVTRRDKDEEIRTSVNKRQMIERELQNRRTSGHTAGDAIIRDARRWRNYRPNSAVGFGDDDWYKVEIKDAYFNGLEVFAAPWQHIDFDLEDECWKSVSAPTATSIPAIPVGRIPLGNIVFIDWEGDEFYPYPHIYCHYKGVNGSPYEEIALYVKHGNDGIEYLVQVDGRTYWDPPRSRWKRLKRVVRIRLFRRRL